MGGRGCPSGYDRSTWSGTSPDDASCRRTNEREQRNAKSDKRPKHDVNISMSISLVTGQPTERQVDMATKLFGAGVSS